MMTKRRLIPLIALCLLLAGCKDPYGGASKAGSAIGVSITQGMQTVSALQMAGTISPTEALNTLGYFEFANKADEAFLSCVAGAHAEGNKVGTYTFCAEAFNSALNTPSELVLLHISDAKASQKITTIITGLSTAVTAIITGLGGA